MSSEPNESFTKLEIFGDDDAAVCGPDGCLLPPDELNGPQPGARSVGDIVEG